jgi:hypothetical protein
VEEEFGKKAKKACGGGGIDGETGRAKAVAKPRMSPRIRHSQTGGPTEEARLHSSARLPFRRQVE